MSNFQRDQPELFLYCCQVYPFAPCSIHIVHVRLMNVRLVSQLK